MFVALTQIIANVPKGFSLKIEAKYLDLNVGIFRFILFSILLL